MTDDVSDLSMPVVEREITALAGHLAAGTCRFLQLLAAFDTGGGWHGTGMRTCAQWLSWKCGLSAGTARDQLRVAHALDGLPVVRGAFAAGRLSYSKVRALSRVASVESEAELVEVATGCTAGQLDRLCAGLARARPSEQVLEHAARASFRAVWEEDGMLRISGRLTAEDGAVLLAALAELREPAVLDPHAAGAQADSTGSKREPDTAPDEDTADGPAARGVSAEMPQDRNRDCRETISATRVLGRLAATRPPWSRWPGTRSTGRLRPPRPCRSG